MCAGAYLGEVSPHSFNFISQCVVEARDQRLKLGQLLHKREREGGGIHKLTGHNHNNNTFYSLQRASRLIGSFDHVMW